MDITFVATTIDAADASASAGFYAELLGWEVTYDADGMAAVEGDGHTLYFGELEGWTAPPWPSDQKQFHLDLRAADGAGAVARAQELGATVPDHQPGETWTVLLDPDGRPFCISSGG